MLHSRCRWKLIVFFDTETSRAAHRGSRLSQGFVHVLITQQVAFRREFLLTSLDVLLGGRVLLQLGWHSVDRQVLVHQIEEARLQLLKQFFTHLADESVVVLVLHVHNELHVVCLGAFR